MIQKDLRTNENPVVAARLSAEVENGLRAIALATGEKRANIINSVMTEYINNQSTKFTKVHSEDAVLEETPKEKTLEDICNDLSVPQIHRLFSIFVRVEFNQGNFEKQTIKTDSAIFSIIDSSTYVNLIKAYFSKYQYCFPKLDKLINVVKIGKFEVAPFARVKKIHIPIVELQDIFKNYKEISL